MTIRTEKYSTNEFKALARTTNGDLVSMFDHFVLLTSKQVALLTEDDRYHYNNYMEELDYELASLMR